MTAQERMIRSARARKRRREKKEIVADVNQLANDSSSLVIADARGLKVSEANELRTEGYKANVSFRVVKNTLIRLSLKGTSYEDIDDDDETYY